MTDRIAFVYRWTHVPTGKWYIGSRTAKGCHPDDGYVCSSNTVRSMILTRPDEWEREIMAYGSAYWMRIMEFNFLDVADIKNNKTTLNKGNFKCPEITSTEGKKRMHKENKNICVRKDDVDFYLLHGWQLGFSKKTKLTMKKNHADVSDDKNPMFGVKRESPFKGKEHIEETKIVIQKKRLEQGNRHGDFVSPCGKLFPSATQAAKQFGVSCPTIIRWAKNNQNGWKFISNQTVNSDTSETQERFLGEEVKRLIRELKI